MPYETCLALPDRLSPKKGVPLPSLRPCKEGGSVFVHVPLPRAQSRMAMVFYTPGNVRGYDGADSSAPSLLRQLSGSYSHAVLACGYVLRRLPFNAHSYAICIQYHMIQHGAAEMTPPRGIAVVPALPATYSYSAPGSSCNGGHLYIEEKALCLQECDRMTQPGHSVVKIWLIVNAPVVIP